MPTSLDRLEVLVAGVDTVNNPDASYRLSAPETDDQLRRRAQGAFDGVARGTLDALRFQLLSLDEVKDVKITEEPNGVPGEIRIDVAYNQDTPEAEASLRERIQQVKPAGIRVIAGAAATRKVHVRVALTLGWNRRQRARPDVRCSNRWKLRWFPRSTRRLPAERCVAPSCSRW